MPKSIHAMRLRELGFEQDGAEPKTNLSPHLKGKALFMAGPDKSYPCTFAVDETGQKWKSKQSIDLTPYGFMSMWHPVLTPLRFTLAPDFPLKDQFELPAYVHWNMGGAEITMAVDETGKCWQAGGEIDLTSHGFNHYEFGTWARITQH